MSTQNRIRSADITSAAKWMWEKSEVSQQRTMCVLNGLSRALGSNWTETYDFSFSSPLPRIVPLRIEESLCVRNFSLHVTIVCRHKSLQIEDLFVQVGWSVFTAISFFHHGGLNRVEWWGTRIAAQYVARGSTAITKTARLVTWGAAASFITGILASETIWLTLAGLTPCDFSCGELERKDTDHSSRHYWRS